MKIEPKTRGDSKPSLTLVEHGCCIIRIINPDIAPYRAGSQRARAWQVVSLMNGLTVKQAHQILALLERNIQGQVGRPLGWVVDALDRHMLEIHQPVSAG